MGKGTLKTNSLKYNAQNTMTIHAKNQEYMINK